MTRFQAAVLRDGGYRPGQRCTQAHDAPELCPALSLTDLFALRHRQPGAGAQAAATRCRPYFSQGVITPDRKTANLAFGIRLMPLDRQKEVVDDIKRRLDPPRGRRRRPWSGCRCWWPRPTARSRRRCAAALTLLAALAGVFLVLLRGAALACATRPCR